MLGTLAIYGTWQFGGSVATRTVTTVSDIPGSNGSLPGSCLYRVPAGATVQHRVGNNFTGAKVVYANGVKAYLPVGTCPHPVDAVQYQAAVTAENDPAFARATNGSASVLYGAGVSGSSAVNGTQRFWYTVSFVRFGNESGPCGGHVVLGEIYVNFLHESYQGQLDLQHPQVEVIPRPLLNKCEGEFQYTLIASCTAGCIAGILYILWMEYARFSVFLFSP